MGALIGNRIVLRCRESLVNTRLVNSVRDALLNSGPGDYRVYWELQTGGRVVLLRLGSLYSVNPKVSMVQELHALGVDVLEITQEAVEKQEGLILGYVELFNMCDNSLFLNNNEE